MYSYCDVMSLYRLGLCLFAKQSVLIVLTSVSLLYSVCKMSMLAPQRAMYENVI